MEKTKLVKHLRRLKRKESRSTKRQKSYQSWVQHQKPEKMRNVSVEAESKDEKKSEKSLSKVSQEDESLDMNDGYESEQSLEKPTVSKSKKVKKKNGLKNEKKKTKFEEYLQMSLKNGVISADEDLDFERKLAKKLKVKKGKLRGDDDGINMLFEGIPSLLDEEEENQDDGVLFEKSKDTTLTKKCNKRKETPNSEHAVEAEITKHVNAEVSKDTTLSKKHKKRKKSSNSEHALEANITNDENMEVSGLAEKGVVEAPEGVLTKATAVKGDAKYVPPHLRFTQGTESAEYTQFRRRVRGLLNRLSETNVESITGEISTILRSVVRGIGSQIISEEVLASCSGGPRGNEQYAAVFAAFVAGMACLVGIDFSAKVVALLAKSFEEEYLKDDNLSLRNLTLLLSYLCIFGVCSCDLVYDFLGVLSKRLTEVDVSTILTILQCCGMKLRSDDPTAMKNFILSVQNRVNELKTSKDAGDNIYNKRMEFMLETICDIKNNRKRPKEDSVQHTRIKKWLQKVRVEDIVIRGLTWKKLLDPDKKGQWWLSGEIASTVDDVEEVAGAIDREVLEAQKMLQLAAAQRMNTEARKAIFCIIMSGEDYIDAFEKLLRLDLPGKQDREIMRVLLDCCLHEKVFNKYYTVLASKLCSYDKNHKFTLQYCLWDYFKELESMELIKSMNLARFVAEMLVSFTLSLAVLKVAELSDAKLLAAKRVMHFRMLFEAIFEHPDGTIWNIFTRIAVSPELETFRNGIEFFVSQYVVGNNRKLAGKYKIAKKALNNMEGVLM